MALRGLIQRQVASALRVIGDLGVSATLSKAGEQTYDFGDSEVDSTATVTSTITLVIVRSSRGGSDGSAYSAEAICNSQVVGSLDQYDTVTASGNTWQISETQDDGYITTLTLTREK